MAVKYIFIKYDKSMYHEGCLSITIKKNYLVICANFSYILLSCHLSS